MLKFQVNPKMSPGIIIITRKLLPQAVTGSSIHPLLHNGICHLKDRLTGFPNMSFLLLYLHLELSYKQLNWGLLADDIQSYVLKARRKNLAEL